MMGHQIKEDEMKEYTIKLRVTVTGASATVEAESEDEARRMVEESWDWDYGTSSIADFEITDITMTHDPEE
jgi:hypothetical protein